MESAFRRYTNLAVALHVLREQCVTLLDPNTWDDRNDAFYMSEYRRLVEARSLLALCFAECPETYHHWRIFSHGTDGVCIEFDKPKLLNCLDSDKRIMHRRVEYKLLSDITRMEGVDRDSLPFYKRWPYAGEEEYRVVFVDRKHETKFHHVNIDLVSIKRIIISPWLAPNLADAVKHTIKSISGCHELRVYQSTLIENSKWKQLTTRAIVNSAE